MNRPTLSVIIPNYNDAAYIGAAMNAILAQSFQPLEVIVVDDGSTDNSVEVVEAFAGRSRLVKLLRNERNMGVIFSFNRGIQAAEGEYCYAASANDLVLPGFFEKSMGLLELHPRAGLCCSDPAILHPSGRIIGEKLHWTQESCYLSPEGFVEVIRPSWKRAGGGTSMILKRSALVEAGGMVPELRVWGDWFAFHVVGFRHGICYIPEAMAAWRAQEQSFASGIRNKAAQRETIIRMLALLRSPAYRDVLPFFQRSGALSILPNILPVLIRNPAYWDFISPILVARVLPYSTRFFLSGITPPRVRRLYHRVRHKTIGHFKG
jgi:glycosyltransferase involved in cell wall biosynthesis